MAERTRCRTTRRAVPKLGTRLVMVTVLAIPGLTALGTRAANATTYTPPDTTPSRYESSADPGTLFVQGENDGHAGANGAVILDFGRPAETGSTPGLLDFGRHVDSLGDVVIAAEQYALGYLRTAPAHSSMLVAIGTNDSCGTGQPCGGSTCGCTSEPPSFLEWGKAWGAAVDELAGWLAGQASGSSVTVHAGAADDAEPGWDPGFTNTHDVLSGYAAASAHPMLDYGSLDGGIGNSFWTPQQMYEVAFGMPPNVPFPEIYNATMASEWTNLAHWSASSEPKGLTFYGVLTMYPDGGYSAAQAYNQLLGDLNTDYADTHQSAVQWSSNIRRGEPAKTTPVTRIAGASRVETAVAVSQTAYPGARSAKVAVLARADTFADALAGGVLAARSTGPLLFTSSDALDTPVAQELSRVLSPGATVYLLGGTAALSSQVSSAVSSLGFVTRRLAGNDRFATAVVVAQALGDPSTVLLANGRDSPDAMVGGVAGSIVHGAVLLTDGPVQAASTLTYLSEHPSDTVYAIGGDASVADPAAISVSGADRYATAAAVAARFFPSVSSAGLASGEAFPDGLAAVTLLGHTSEPLLLTPGGDLAAQTGAYLVAHRAGLTAVQLFGGEAALTQSVEAQVDDDLAT